jgi:hypothetical protein
MLSDLGKIDKINNWRNAVIKKDRGQNEYQ